MKPLSTFLATAIVLTGPSIWAATDRPVLVSATATSSSPDSSPVLCLLNEGCKGLWSPGSKDKGLNEGIYLQFQDPVEIGAIEVVSDADLIASVNASQLSEGYTPQGRSSTDAAPRVQQFFVGAKSADAHVEPIQVKSFFLRIGDVKDLKVSHPKITSIRFYRTFDSVQEIAASPKPMQIPVILPTIVNAEVNASSVLEPQVAYQAAHLFDSRPDFAWSTNGKKTNGKGETLTVKFKTPVNIAGLMIWNGYQRSESHYRANGRVSKLSISGNGVANTVAVSDEEGMQKLSLEKPLLKTHSVVIKIDDIYRGSKYPDVLISEIRFVDSEGSIIFPVVAPQKPKLQPQIAPLMDRSFSSLACRSSAEAAQGRKHRRTVSADHDDQETRFVRFRSDGTFVIFNRKGGEWSTKSTVMEGNWASMPNGIRIFGKRYKRETNVQQRNYGQSEETSPVEIFQSDFTIGKFKELTGAQQKQLASLLITNVKAFDNPRVEPNGGSIFTVASNSGWEVTAPSRETLKTNLQAELNKINPLTIQSSLFADALLPSEDSTACQ
jgi:hypothetical protein